MSVRNMLKVMMSLLLAVTLAATTAHAARFDQSFASAAEAVQVKEKSENSGLIPYKECIKTCSKCACTRMWPPESNMCFCLKDDSVHKEAATVVDRLDLSLASVTEKAHELYEKLALLAGPVPKRTSADDKKMVLWTTSKLEGFIPYTECIKTCKTCACTLVYPPEASICICGDPKPQAAGGKAVAK